MAENVIEVRNLIKRYRHGRTNAVDGISFDVPEAELFCLLGPNGAGKTTTVSILTTTLAMTSGSVLIAGTDLASEQARVRGQVAIVFQGASLDLNLTAEENIRVHAVLYGLYPWRPLFRLMPRQYRRQVEEMAVLLRVDDVLGRPVRALSGGTRRKLEIVRALMHRPRVLFLDEPTVGLDPQSRRSLWSYLTEARHKYETTVFLTTHYLEEAEPAETVCVIVNGRVVEMGSPAAIKGRHPAPAPVRPAEPGPSLEDAYLELLDARGPEVGPDMKVASPGPQSTPPVATRSLPPVPALEAPVARPQPGRRAGRELSGLAAIAQRDVIKLARDPLRLAVSLAFPVMLIAGLGYALQPTVGKATGLDELDVAFTGVLAATLFQSAAAGMISVVEDRENDFARELFVTPVSRLALVSGKVLGETLVALVQGTFVVVFAIAFGLGAGARQIAVLVAPGLACGLLGASFGLATLAALPNQRSATQIFQFLIIPQYVLGGVLVPVHGLPAVLESLAWAMPLTYAVDLTRAFFYHGKPGYNAAVSLGPQWAVAVMAAMFAAFVVTGALVFNYRERYR